MSKALMTGIILGRAEKVLGGGLTPTLCFNGQNAGMVWECCHKGYNSACFDEVFTFEKCCLDITQPGDQTCWAGSLTFDSCCTEYVHWFPTWGCFDGNFTFKRCCGGHVAILWFLMKKRFLGWGRKLWLRLPGPFLRLLGLSLCFRAVAVWRAGKIGAATLASVRRRSIVVPAATSLRVMATCGLVAYHSAGYCGYSRQCSEEWASKDAIHSPFKQYLRGYLVIHTDLFFVLTAYIATVSATCSSKKLNIRAMAVDYASIILRRSARVLPVIIVGAAILEPYVPSVIYLFKMYRPGVYLGVLWPGRVPNSWSLGVEMLCLAILHGILAIINVAGEVVGLSVAMAILAFCLNRRLAGGSANHAEDPLEGNAWLSAHVALSAHRLPIILATLLFTCLLRHIPSSSTNRREIAVGDSKDDSASQGLSASGRNCAHLGGRFPITSEPVFENNTLEVRSFLVELGYACYIEGFLKNGFDEMNIVQEMLEHHLILCGVLPGHMLKIQLGLKSYRSSCLKSKCKPWVCCRQELSHWFNYVHNSVIEQLVKCQPTNNVPNVRLECGGETCNSTIDGPMRSHGCYHYSSTRTRITLQLAAMWILAIVGIHASAGLEWLWYSGPRILLPYWFYPFPAKLPLVLGCVVLLEFSRRLAAGGHIGTNSVLSWLELRSFVVLYISENVEKYLSEQLPDHKFDVNMFFYQLPALFFFCMLGASAVAFVEEPFRDALASFLNVFKTMTQADIPKPRHARSSLVAWFSSALMVLAACFIVVSTAIDTCSEPFPSPCLL